ncbi:MAG: small multi-drug export protein, partial [Victivallales bacterium]|nr:small multi-drug export protein [Victivallales bacterium]
VFEKYLERAQRKLKPQIEKYGTMGLALFIGIPLPGTGAYTGAAGAFALGMKKRQFAIANIAGVCMAGIAVTIIFVLIRAGIESPLFNFLIKR